MTSWMTSYIFFSIFIVLQTAVYIAERFVIQWNFSDLKNPRFIIESGFKSRAGYNGARTVLDLDQLLSMPIEILTKEYEQPLWFLDNEQ